MNWRKKAKATILGMWGTLTMGCGLYLTTQVAGPDLVQVVINAMKIIIIVGCMGTGFTLLIASMLMLMEK
uniref:Uncharacterized protein n=1 Tax=viral metagenome TaxID=1070528 RepID=A0A6M3JB89_9ZZZZ